VSVPPWRVALVKNHFAGMDGTRASADQHVVKSNIPSQKRSPASTLSPRRFRSPLVPLLSSWASPRTTSRHAGSLSNAALPLRILPVASLQTLERLKSTDLQAVMESASTEATGLPAPSSLVSSLWIFYVFCFPNMFVYCPKGLPGLPVFLLQ
jgi:hypothetical protein